MFSSSKLSEEQKATIRQWADGGATMADLQRRLGEELEIRLTYMETRFLVLDLGLQFREESKAEEKKAEGPALDGDDLDDDDVPAGPVGGVAVTVDDLAVPGAVVSGRVTFADGQRAMWYLDQMGRLGLDPDVAGYRPSREDIAEFQRQLQAQLRRSGF
jgi:hypothetical protein